MESIEIIRDRKERETGRAGPNGVEIDPTTEPMEIRETKKREDHKDYKLLRLPFL